jgi:ELWxxDGT repeat protein
MHSLSRRRRRFCAETPLVVVAAFVCLAAGAAQAQVPTQIAEINTTTIHWSSNPSEFTQLGSTTLFVATEYVRGAELWKTDGTSTGTVMVMDIYPGMNGSVPHGFVEMGGLAYFTATTYENGAELWRSDGTAAGTTLVRDIAPGLTGSDPQLLTVVGGQLFFSAYTSYYGQELWVSNGTSAGTQRVRTLASGAGLSNPVRTVNAGGYLLVEAASPSSGLWRTDGTIGGTARLGDITLGLTARAVVVGGLTYFNGSDGLAGSEVWVTDGTALGTHLFADLAPGAAASQPADFCIQGSTVLFLANDGTNGRGLYRLEAVGATRIQPAGTTAEFLSCGAGQAFFGAVPSGGTGREFWSTDGTAAGSALLKAFGAGASFGRIVRWGSSAFFAANDAASGMELWTSDGTVGGTAQVLDIVAGAASSTPQNLKVAGGLLYFGADDGTAKFEPWVSDGTLGGTHLLKDIGGLDDWGSSPEQFVRFGGKVYFSAVTDDPWPTPRNQLWVTDGTTLGTSCVAIVGTPTVGKKLSNLVATTTALFFVVDDALFGRELWTSDGTATGTLPVLDIVPGPGSSNPTALTAVGATLYFVATDAAHGEEVWKSDGTAAGTQLLKDIHLGTTGSTPSNLTAWNGSLVFFADDGTIGLRPYRSTGVGAYPLGNLGPGTASSASSPFWALGSKVLFVGVTGSTTSLWSSDGSAGNASLLQNLGASDPLPSRQGLVAGGTFYFAYDDGVSGSELWASDGTTLGTRRVKDICFGADPSNPRNFTELNGAVYFAANDGSVTGTELWKTDGTNAGTQLVKDICVDAAASCGSQPRNFSSAGGRLYFTAVDIAHGEELWTTDGSSAGTFLVADLGPGTAWGVSGPSVLLGTNLIFAGQTKVQNSELWKLSVDLTAPVIDVTVVGTQGPGGWYTSDVAVTFTVSDPESAIRSSSGCGPVVVGTDTAATTLTCTASSMGGTSTKSVTLKRDATAPVLTCPVVVLGEASGPAGAQVAFAPTAFSDSIDPAPQWVAQPDAGTLFALGDTVVRLDATDEAGNHSSCSLVVTVADTTPPVVTCPADLEVASDSGNGATVNFAATATDTVDASPSVAYTVAPGSRFPIGARQVTATARDHAGNEATCTFVVTVTTTSTTPPDVTVNGNGDGPAVDKPTGCGCTQGGAFGSLLLPMLAAALLLGRRRPTRRLTAR